MPDLLDMFEQLEFTIELLLAEMLFVVGARRKAHGYVMTVVLVLIMCGISLALPYEAVIGAMGEWGIMLRCWFLLALSIAGMCICNELIPARAVLYGVAAYTVQNMAFAIHECLKVIWPQFCHRDMSECVRLVSIVIIYSVVYVLAERLVIRQIRGTESMIDPWREALLVTGMLLIVTVLSTFTHNRQPQDVLLLRSLSIIGCIMGLAVAVEMQQRISLQMQMQVMHQQEHIRENYYENLRRNMDEVNLRCHDFKHQLAGYRNGRNEVHIPEEELQRLEEGINIYDSFAKTGNEALDVILTEKALICQKEQIRFTYMADSRELDSIESRDIYNLFGNALDNAIEAVCKIDQPQKRIINLTALRQGAFLEILISNYCQEQPLIIDGLPQTTKDDSLFHGYGLRSILRIAERYGGEMHIRNENDIFELQIVFPLPIRDVESAE